MMSAWIILTLLAAFLVSSASIFEKKTLLSHHAMEFVTVLSLCTMLLALPVFI
jgi:uncharacterized membrane protein